MEARYPVLLSAIVLWWWWLGSRIDFGVLGYPHFRRPKLFVIMLAGVAVLLVYVGTKTIIDEVHRWSNYQPPHALFLVRAAGVVLWSFALAGGCVLAARRLLQGRLPALRERGPAVLRYGVAIVGMTAVVTSLIGISDTTKMDPDVCVSSDYGCVLGTIVNENGAAVKGIEVELVSAEKTGEARWYSRRSAWTDSKGSYRFSGLEPGKYLIAVHYYDAPNFREPFATAFYPGTGEESNAEPVLINANSRVTLRQLRLQSLSLTTVKVEVIWPDGTRPKRSNLAFHNTGYPDQAVIGDVAPQIDDGAGEFTLPEGFNYEARATVQCDSGGLIASRESPVQQIKVSNSTTPRELTFTIPGPPCEIWRPK